MVTSEVAAESFGPVVRPRHVEHVSYGEQTTDGAGVKLTRVIGKDLHQRLDPFLMLDAFRSNWPDDFIAGFPDHPHRGFEAITYLLSGRMHHRDSAGHEGVIEGGGVQWMSAGRGVVHSEMPEQENGTMEGFQLWLNLPARDKMGAPWYLDVQRGEIPVFVTATGTTVRVIAGSSHGVMGAFQRPVTEPLLLDVVLPSQCRLEQPLCPAFNAFVYVYRGTVTIGDRAVEEGQLAILSNDRDSDGICLVGEGAAQLLLVAGRPLGERVVQRGPFVMNSEEEIAGAIRDFKAGRLVAS
ncbi:MAG: pirin family protein [Methylococcaceae bacterium]|nr:pirin family protein [Methylococcaceae bacterium]